MKKEKDNLRLIVADNILDFGEKVDNKLKSIKKSSYSYIVPIKLSRFSNSEGRGDILETVRGKDVFILSDVNNYSCKYNMFGETQRMSYDDHFQDIKRLISASIGTANRIWVVMPLLYESRQHKREGRQSLDCAMSLKELEFHGVTGIITFDAHDPSVGSSSLSAKTSFDNLYPTNTMLNQFIDDEDIDFNHLVVVNPDAGAVKRANHFANLLLADTGGFRKRRDLTKIENGQSPVVEHVYEGSVPLKNKNVIIVDDMIASGGSMIEVMRTIKNQSPNKVYIFSTFSLFSDGKKSINLFKKSYKEGLFNKIYTTNLSYIPDDIKNEPWLIQVDCSMQLAQVINAEGNNTSITPFMNGQENIIKKVLAKQKKSKQK